MIVGRRLPVAVLDGPTCPECRHSSHDEGHRYTGRGVCDGCEPCRRFRSTYNLWLRYRTDADVILMELDAEWVMRTGYQFGPVAIR